MPKRKKSVKKAKAKKPVKGVVAKKAKAKAPKKPKAKKSIKKPVKAKKSIKKLAKTPKVTSFKEGQKVKRIDIFRLFDESSNSWNRWDKDKSGWVKVPYKTEVKDLEFTVVRVGDCMSGYTMYWAESKNWRIRWVQKPKNEWGFLSVLRQDLLKDN